MTNLELAICEAENNGEIGIDTRDTMLGILNESTSQARNSEKIRKQIFDLNKKKEQLKQLKKKFEDEGNERMADATGDKIHKIINEISDLSAKRDRIDPDRLAYKTQLAGREAAGARTADDVEYFDRLAKRGERHSRRNPWRGNSGRNDREPGRYKTTNGIKESVLEEIYEAELCGDITPEERMALIDYMDM